MTFLKTFAGLTALASLGACSAPGPSVPFSQGQDVEVARAAVETCESFATGAGRKRVTTMYFVNGALWGVIPGLIGTAAYSSEIAQNGEADAVDRCMKDLGFDRRDLTATELRALDSADPTTRANLLDHFVAGGQLETFSGT